MRPTASKPSPARIRAVDEESISSCFPLMQQMRPHLADRAAFIASWRRQVKAGYCLLAIWVHQTPIALAGYRIQENLIHGRFLYVDDLVTDAQQRRSGHGRGLLERLKEEGRANGCRKLVLDTGLDNPLAHRFYYRAGLLAQALRFNVPLD